MIEEEFQLPEEVKITVFREQADNVLALLRHAGFEPERIDQSDGDTTSFVFNALTEERMWAIVSAVPPAYYAVRGTIGGPIWSDRDA